MRCFYSFLESTNNIPKSAYAYLCIFQYPCISLNSNNSKYKYITQVKVACVWFYKRLRTLQLWWHCSRLNSNSNNTIMLSMIHFTHYTIHPSIIMAGYRKSIYSKCICMVKWCNNIWYLKTHKHTYSHTHSMQHHPHLYTAKPVEPEWHTYMSTSTHIINMK